VNTDVSALLAAAKKIVQEAGHRASRLSLGSRKILKRKKNGDLVTTGDHDVEKYVRKELEKQFPDHGLVFEEMGQKNPTAEYVWILDPIDGTKYYAKGIPLYSVSLALARDRELILGVVYTPELDRMYCASSGQGATLNGHKIQCSNETYLDKTSICLEIPSRDSTDAELRWALEKMSVLIEQTYRVRIIGVGSLGLCFCASGGFDAYVNLGSMWKRHDIAAGQVIVQEAGGEFLYVGEEEKQIIAGPETLCSKIRDILKI
jgi:myo-inositol-1(or 4)-monophosphatase